MRNTNESAMLTPHNASKRRLIRGKPRNQSRASGRNVTASDSAHSVREERAFDNAAGDPHVFPIDTFIGRDTELHALRESIDSTPARVTGIVGPAGVGKPAWLWKPCAPPMSATLAAW